jgi:hypothetical protein
MILPMNNICTDLLYKHAVYMVAIEKYSTFAPYLFVGIFLVYTARKIGLAGERLGTKNRSDIDEAKVLYCWSYICGWVGAFIVIYGVFTMIPKELDVLAAQKIPAACIEFSLSTAKLGR